MATRRSILQTGAAAAVILGAGAAAWSLTRAPKLAREPWSKAGTSFGDARLDALAYAILAPNPHNMQPWRVRLDGEDALTIFADLSRMLPETDPPNRQIVIGFGCFLELLRQAAAEKGFKADIAPFPEGEPQPLLDRRPIASVRLIRRESATPDPLFAAALSRRTNRAPFSKTPIGRDAMLPVLDAARIGFSAGDVYNSVVALGGATEGPAIDDLRALARDAWKIEWALDRTRRESINVTRIGKAEIDAAPWGLSLAGPMMEALGVVGALTRENMDAPGKSAYEQSRDFYLKAIDTAAAFVWMTTRTNTRRDQLAAGAAWVRLHQAATLEGLAFHPLSQALQEFPEMAPAYDRAHEMLAHHQGATVQMLARIGYADAPPPAPREALMSKIVAA